MSTQWHPNKCQQRKQPHKLITSHMQQCMLHCPCSILSRRKHNSQLIRIWQSMQQSVNCIFPCQNNILFPQDTISVGI